MNESGIVPIIISGYMIYMFPFPYQVVIVAALTTKYVLVVVEVEDSIREYFCAYILSVSAFLKD